MAFECNVNLPLNSWVYLCVLIVSRARGDDLSNRRFGFDSDEQQRGPNCTLRRLFALLRRPQGRHSTRRIVIEPNSRSASHVRASKHSPPMFFPKSLADSTILGFASPSCIAIVDVTWARIGVGFRGCCCFRGWAPLLGPTYVVLQVVSRVRSFRADALMCMEFPELLVGVDFTTELTTLSEVN
jgi:hypothetical protein